MKMTKITCLTLATVLLASSCTSAYQASSGLTGAMIGGRVGSSVGYLSGHGRFRGENAALGGLIGMGVGAMLGVGIANQIEQNERSEARRYDGSQINTRTSRDDYDEQIGGGAYGGKSSLTMTSISDLCYMDADGDGYISKGETIEVESFVTNTSDMVLQDIVIYLSVSNQKDFRISPSLTTTLQPGQKIRYTGRVHCNKARNNQSIGIELNTSYAGRCNTSNTLFVRTR